MARLEIRLPKSLKRRVIFCYPNISKKIRELLIKDVGFIPLQKVPSIKRVGQKGGHLS